MAEDDISDREVDTSLNTNGEAEHGCACPESQCACPANPQGTNLVPIWLVLISLLLTKLWQSACDFMCITV
uniref:Uncharacterized protein n=1 Tax=Pseudodiaptomus poplesia TaxID=213370 RepID=A0A1S6GLB0_9MAXI|nr:hypothetical protein [Pseudodiaptomus poplesia]